MSTPDVQQIDSAGAAWLELHSFGHGWCACLESGRKTGMRSRNAPSFVRLRFRRDTLVTALSPSQRSGTRQKHVRRCFERRMRCSFSIEEVRELPAISYRRSPSRRLRTSSVSCTFFSTTCARSTRTRMACCSRMAKASGSSPARLSQEGDWGHTIKR